jgi:putative mRNA 3-end processing factor
MQTGLAGVGVGEGVVRILLERALHGGRGIAATIEPHLGHRAKVQAGFVIGVEGEAAVGGGERLGGVVRLELDRGDEAVGLGGGRVKADRFLSRAAGDAIVVLLGGGPGEGEMGGGVLRAGSHGLESDSARLIELVLLEQTHRQQREGLDIVRALPECDAELTLSVRGEGDWLSSLVADLIQSTPDGLFCPRGGVHIDPWRPVPLALITHAHSDHARPGSGRYLCAASGVGVLRRRLGGEAVIEGVAWGERRRFGEVTVSFHPAGHLLGSAQIRVEADGDGAHRVWVFTGDYKRMADPSCEGFEVVPCDVLISEATFALPIYRWPRMERVMEELLSWWDRNREEGRASVVFCYALGKAQRLLAEIGARRDATVYVHGAIEPLTECYREAGVAMAKTVKVADVVTTTGKGRNRQRLSFAGELILAPTSAYGSTWMRRFGEASTAFASGWMRVRGVRRWRGFDRGFVVSDHADWDELVQTVRETGAKRVLLTHGYSDALVRYLRELGVEAEALKTEFEGEGGGEEAGGLGGAAVPPVESALAVDAGSEVPQADGASRMPDRAFEARSGITGGTPVPPLAADRPAPLDGDRPLKGDTAAPLEGDAPAPPERSA